MSKNIATLKSWSGSVKIIECCTIREIVYGVLLVFYSNFVPKNRESTRMMGIPGRRKRLAISPAVWIQSINVTDRQTVRRTDTGRQQRPRLRIASRGKNHYTPCFIKKRPGICLLITSANVDRFSKFFTLGLSSDCVINLI